MRRAPFPPALLGVLALAACGTAATAPAARPAPATVAAAPTTAASPPRDEATLRGPFLWRIDGPTGASYLFGTIHAGVQADRELPPVVWESLAAAEAFFMEADLAAAAPGELMKRAALPDGENLERLLGKRDWNRLVDLVGRGVPPRSLRRLRPWMVYSLILQMFHPTPKPLDLALQERAAALGKEMNYLEPWTAQVDVLAETMDVDDLRELVADGDKARRQVEALIAAYRAGDLGALAAIALDPAEAAAHPERTKRMFDDRNRTWVEALVPRLASDRLFVAVGAGHLPGERGLLALLRARGLTLRRVEAPPIAPAPAADSATPTTASPDASTPDAPTPTPSDTSP